MEDISEKKFKELNEEEQNYIRIAVLQQSDNLKNLYFAAVERGINALFFINGGGGVAVLTYMSSSNSSCAKLLLCMSLLDISWRHLIIKSNCSYS